MINKIIDYICNKRIAILGFGLEGKSTLKFIKNHLPDKEITIIDKNTNIEKEDNINYILGEDYLDHLDEFDMVIKTPGISLVDKKFSAIITSQWDLFLANTDSNVIGITGTKGKSTTTTLIYDIIKNQNDNTYLVGNIGIPLFDYIEDFNKDTIVVAELSAHQLYDIKRSPHISIITNFYEEHLDYYHTLDNYYNSKLNIFRYQSKDDYAIYLEDNEDLNERVNNLDISSIRIPLGEKNIVDNKIILDEEVFDLKEDKKLLGHYNDLNIMMALEVVKLLDLDLVKAGEVVKTFEGLDHRMKKVAQINGISFYDDTLATIPASSINSVRSIPNVKTLILGGMDRNIDYDRYIKDLKNSNLDNIICQPDTGKYIYNSLNGKCDKNIYYIEDLESAVKKAFEITKTGEAVLLSPAAPSYNIYKNYADKSNHYINIINDLK